MVLTSESKLGTSTHTPVERDDQEEAREREERGRLGEGRDWGRKERRTRDA